MQVGFEIWTMQNDILFDNIYIGHSIEDAEKFRKETFDVKKPIELAEEEAQKPKKEDKKAGVSFRENPVAYVRDKADLFITLAKADPIHAVKTVPEIAGGLGALLLTLVLIIVGAISISTPAAAPAGKKAEKGKEAAKDKAEATSSSADTKSGATKRNTRSSSDE